MSKDTKLNVILLICSVVMTFVLIVTGKFIQETYNIKVGQIFPKTIYAPREMQNKVATERKKEQIANSVEPKYEINPLIEEEAKETIDLLFRYVDAVKSDEVTVYNINPVEILKSKSPVPLYMEHYQLLVELSDYDASIVKNQILEIIEAVYTKGVSSDNQSKMLTEARNSLESSSLSIAQSKLGYEIISNLIKPNMTIDAEATEELIKETISKVEPIMILQGEKIIEQGTRITEETYENLEEAGYVKNEISNNLKRYLGASGVTLVLAFLFAYYMNLKKKEINLNSKEKVLLFVLYIIAILTTRVLVGIKFVYSPIIIVPMLCAILINHDVAIILNIIIVIVSTLIYKGDITYVHYFMMTGTLSSIYVNNIKERNKILETAAYVGTLNFLVIFAVETFTHGVLSVNFILDGMVGFVVGVLSLVMVVGSLPFWEVVFDVVTPIKLLELTNPNQPLLKRLLLEATGTYHHSLLVANLAETAATDIGANSLLARVGGYYHDIGKLGYVSYYKENQIVENPHDYLEPGVSADIILSHVTRGSELATQHKLPKCVKDIINQHHGTTCAQYFYIQAVNAKSAEEVNKADFQYKGPKPQTKEAALVMLADVVEATIRSIMPTKKEDISLEEIVSKMIKQKLQDGQLDESSLMIQDIEKITRAFTRILTGMYHERITYPEKIKKDDNDEHTNT